MSELSTGSKLGGFWSEIIRRDTPAAFANAFSGTPYLEGSSFTGRIEGAAMIQAFFNETRQIYEKIAFTDEILSAGKIYMEWEGAAFGGMTVSGATILTLDTSGKIQSVYLYHRSFEAVSCFSAELARRLAGRMDPAYFRIERK